MLGARARIVVAACHHPQPPISSESISIQWFTRRISLRHWFAYSAPTTCVLQSGILPCSKHLTHPTWRRSPGAMRRSCSACRGSVTAPRCRRPDKVSNRAPVKPQTAGRQTCAGRHSSHFCTGERGLERYSSRISDLKIGEMLPERRSRGTSHSTPATYSFPESFSSNAPPATPGGVPRNFFRGADRVNIVNHTEWQKPITGSAKFLSATRSDHLNV